MSMRPKTGRSSLTDRAFEVVLHPARHVAGLTVLAYLAGIAGMGVAFFGGIDRVQSVLSLVGIVLLAISFGVMFWISLTVATLEG